MKKLFVCLFLLLCLILCVSCDLITDRNDARGENEYKLTVIDTFGYLAEPLEEYYTAGQEVKVHIIFLSGPLGGINLNGEKITDYELSEDASPIYTFTMPAMDSVLYTTQNGYIGIECDEDSHSFGEGKLINATDGNHKVAYVCQVCGKWKRITLQDTFSRAGSAADSNLYFNALNSSQIEPDTLPIYKFDTLEELESFKTTYGGESGFNFGWDEVPSFNDATKAYNEEFFKNNTLILVYITTSSGSERFGISSVSYKENAFNIYIHQTNDTQVGTEDEAAWFITLTMPDDIIEKCTVFDAHIKLLNDSCSFDDLYGVTSYIDPSSISKVKIDQSIGIIARGMRNVMITTDEDYINSVIDFIYNAQFTRTYQTYDGGGNYVVTLYTDDSFFEFEFSTQNEFCIGNYFYTPTIKFPTTGRFEDWYDYLAPLGEIKLSSYGEITTLTDFNISEIHLRDISIDVFIEDYTKDADLIIQAIEDYTIQIVSPKLVRIDGYGWYMVVSEKDFGELIPEDESEAIITFTMDDEKTLGCISVSKNTIYTREEIENIVRRMTGNHILSILNSDGTEYVDREFTSDETITLILEPRC